MAIFQLFDQIKQEEKVHPEPELEAPPRKGGFFSTLVTRFSFLFLLAADLVWLLYTVGQILVIGTVYCLSFGKRFNRAFSRAYLSFRRALVCAVSLLIGLFCPAFGMMVACTYFLMYDKTGIDEVIPAPLQAQFRELFQV